MNAQEQQIIAANYLMYRAKAVLEWSEYDRLLRIADFGARNMLSNLTSQYMIIDLLQEAGSEGNELAQDFERYFSFVDLCNRNRVLQVSAL